MYILTSHEDFGLFLNGIGSRSFMLHYDMLYFT